MDRIFVIVFISMLSGFFISQVLSTNSNISSLLVLVPLLIFSLSVSLILVKTPLKDFYRVIKLEDTDNFEENKGESETLAGFVLEKAGSFPRRGEKILFGSYFQNYHVEFEMQHEI